MKRAPLLSKRFFCIINRKEKVLAAAISSCLYVADEYFTLIEFSDVDSATIKDGDDPFNENYIMANRADETRIRTSNALIRLSGVEYLIIAGLTDGQKEFLPFLVNFNVIEIASLSDVQNILEPLTGKREYFYCREENVCLGLYYACREDKILRIDRHAPSITCDLEYGTKGLVLIEENEYLSAIVAVNYALSIRAEIEVVREPNADIHEVKNLISQWKTEKNNDAYKDLSALIYPNIEGIEFNKYVFATFFTHCLPYSLILRDVIPFSYVNTWYRPDFFIFNNLFAAARDPIWSAIVFSPLEFGSDEETLFVIKKLEQNQFLVKKLIGEVANVYNIENHVREYPYEILHICSHGGEVPGYPVVHEFKDKRGESHTIEYDDVLSFAPNKGDTLIGVTHKYIYRKLDGFDWRSEEFKNVNYPHDVFTSMMESITSTKPKYGTRIENVDGSCSIKCSDFVYQAMFNAVAGQHLNPFVFNNTCWSWSGVSDAFLVNGCMGYVGTLWDVDNKVAVPVAESFYESIFDKTILFSFHDAIKYTHGTNSENIYVYWGLHFSHFTKGNSVDTTKKKIASILLGAFYDWRDKGNAVTEKKDKDKFRRLEDWNNRQLFEFFFKEALMLVRPFRNKI